MSVSRGGVRGEREEKEGRDMRGEREKVREEN